LKKRNIIISGMLVLSIALSTSMGAFAATDSSNVSDSAVTQENNKRSNFVQLSEEQRKAIGDAKINSLKEAASNLVAKGTLTQEQVEEILAETDKLPSDLKGSKKGNGRFVNLTAEQKDALKTENQTLFESALSQLVSDGSITQEISDQLKAGKKAKTIELTDEQKTVVNEARKNSLESSVTNLVNNGTITQEIADSILSASTKYVENKEINKSLKENGPFKNLTDEQIKALKDETSTVFKNALSELVTKGTITQEIADQIQNMPFGRGYKMRPDRFDGRGINETSTDNQSALSSATVN